MPDPRTFTVAPCPSAYADKSGTALSNSSNTRRDFFNAVGKVGDLEVLNSIGAGKIGTGLRNLASISNTIRVGTGSLPTSIGTSLDTGANWVLEQAGIAPTTVSALQAFQPAIANQAYGQAQAIYQQVKQGNFKATDIPSYLQDLQNLERLGRNIYTPGSSDAQSSLGAHCVASPYAVDLITRAPKFKFLFVVQFVPNDGYSQLGSDGFDALSMAFTVKKSSRPNIRFQTEDVNYYNFRSKVVTKTEFEEMQMSFYDDTTNYAMQFYRAYLRAMSPITGIEAGTDASILEGRGMDFVDNTLQTDVNSGSISANTYAASLGPLANDVKNVFKEITLFHIYDYGINMNVYHFFNPRITALNFDELDMSVGTEGTEVSFNFNYDSVYIEPVVPLQTKTDTLAGAQRGAVYPLQYNGSPAPAASTGSGISPFGTPTNGTVSSDPLQLVNNLSNTVTSTTRAVTAAVDNLAKIASNPFQGLPFG